MCRQYLWVACEVSAADEMIDVNWIDFEGRAKCDLSKNRGVSERNERAESKLVWFVLRVASSRSSQLCYMTVSAAQNQHSILMTFWQPEKVSKSKRLMAALEKANAGGRLSWL